MRVRFLMSACLFQSICCIRSCILLNYMFQNFRVELIQKATGSGNRNMQIVICEGEGIITVCV